MNASPKKLKDGSWGAVINGTAHVGDKLTITTRAGKSWESSVASIVWTDSKLTIVSTGSAPSSRSDSGYTQESCGYPCPVSGQRCTPTNPCHDCI